MRFPGCGLRAATAYNAGMAKRFRRRYYTRLSAFVQDLREILARRGQIRTALRAQVSLPFRERLMLVVTEVNGCRYCSYFHAQVALTSGITEPELRELLAGSIPAQTSAEELPALVYAQHWAERDGRPEPEAEHRLREVYGDPRADAIHIVLRMIRIGNLLGNTGDYLLHVLTFGWLGVRDDENRYLTSAPGPKPLA